MTGLLITIEGTEGSGKTSLLKKLVPQLKEKTTTEIVVTREPGGSKISEKIRSIILDRDQEKLDPSSEALLFAASRRQLMAEVIEPSLALEKIVIMDRFVDSSLAYQGVASGLGIKEIEQINDFATKGKKADLTLFLDLPVEIGLQRIKEQRAEEINRLDLAGIDFHRQVHQGYEKLAKMFPDRIKKINAKQSIEQVVVDSLQAIFEKFPSILE